MYLEKDAFTVCYRPDEVDLDAIMAKIRGLGYRPERIELAELDKPVGKERVHQRKKTEGMNVSPVKGTLPEPVAVGLEASKRDGKILLLDFHASWCGPCRKLAKDMERPNVRKALKDYVVVKVDTDKYPGAAHYFGVKALPTLIVLDAKGQTLFRKVGLMSPQELATKLRTLAKETGVAGAVHRDSK